MTKMKIPYLLSEDKRNSRINKRRWYYFSPCLSLKQSEDHFNNLYNLHSTNLYNSSNSNSRIPSDFFRIKVRTPSRGLCLVPASSPLPVQPHWPGCWPSYTPSSFQLFPAHLLFAQNALLPNLMTFLKGREEFWEKVR